MLKTSEHVISTCYLCVERRWCIISNRSRSSFTCSSGSLPQKNCKDRMRLQLPSLLILAGPNKIYDAQGRRVKTSETQPRVSVGTLLSQHCSHKKIRPLAVQVMQLIDAHIPHSLNTIRKESMKKVDMRFARRSRIIHAAVKAKACSALVSTSTDSSFILQFLGKVLMHVMKTTIWKL